MNTQTAGVWVKASERLPGWYMEATWRHPGAEIVNERMLTSVAMELCSHLMRELEWLNESPDSEAGDGWELSRIDEMLTWAEKDGWVFNKGKWKQSGYIDRTTHELYRKFESRVPVLPQPPSNP